MIDRPIGYVVDSSTVVGEWEGTGWRNVPRKAHLYLNAPADVRPMYEAGELEARRWVRGRHRTHGRITGYTWWGPNGVHTITNLRGDLDKVPVGDRAGTLMEWAAYMRSLGANVSSPSSTTHSVIRAALNRPAYIARDGELPIGDLWRGSRIEHRGGIRVEYGRSFLWDIASAFPAALIDLAVPARRWHERKVEPRSHIPPGPGFGHAVVFIPPDTPMGPLPDRWSGPIRRFPTDEALDGVWSFSELRAAEQVGCSIMLTTVWTGDGVSHPFAEFGQLLADMRRNLSEGAYRIAKRGAVGQVGSFAREGRQKRSRFIDGTEQVWEHGGYCVPESLGIHAQVTADVRAKLYAEGIAPHADMFVSCHTDGVILQDDERTLIGTGLGLAPGDWAAKRYMSRVMLLDAQRYAYEDADDPEGGIRYSVAGVPQRYVETMFMRKWNGTMPQPRPERDYSRRPTRGGGTRITRERVKVYEPGADTVN